MSMPTGKLSPLSSDTANPRAVNDTAALISRATKATRVEKQRLGRLRTGEAEGRACAPVLPGRVVRHHQPPRRQPRHVNARVVVGHGGAPRRAPRHPSVHRVRAVDRAAIRAAQHMHRRRRRRPDGWLDQADLDLGGALRAVSGGELPLEDVGVRDGEVRGALPRPAAVRRAVHLTDAFKSRAGEQGGAAGESRRWRSARRPASPPPACWRG